MYNRKHYRSNTDAAKFMNSDDDSVMTANGKYEMSAPGHKLWRWENSRGDSVSVTGHQLKGARFSQYAVSLNGHIVTTSTSRTEAEREAAQLRQTVPDVSFTDSEGALREGVRDALMAACKHLTDDNVSHMNNGELLDLYQESDKSEYPPYELPENDEN